MKIETPKTIVSELTEDQSGDLLEHFENHNVGYSLCEDRMTFNSEYLGVFTDWLGKRPSTEGDFNLYQSLRTQNSRIG